MANCNEYQQLSFQEKCIMIGQCIHILQNDSESFVAIGSMIRSAGQQGKLDDVKILPPHEEIDKY